MNAARGSKFLPCGMMRWATRVLAVWIGLASWLQALASVNEVVKDRTTGNVYLFNSRTQLLRLLPNKATAAFLGLDYEQAKAVDASTFGKISNPIAPAALPPPNPDAAVANMLLKVGALSPQTFWRGKAHIPMFNPSIARWKDRWLVAYRNHSDISLAWLRHVSDDRFEPVYSDTFLGLRDAGGSNPWSAPLSSDRYREDPRLLVRSKNSMISMSFVRLRARWDPPQISYINITASEHKVMFSKEETLYVGGSQKNWVPFEYRGEQLWISSINPLLVVRHSSSQANDDSKWDAVATVSEVVNANASAVLPWAEEYGLPIRGGTPAIKLRGVYFAFFHTLSKFQEASFGLKTYFMGAITFCPEPPFSIHSMSAHPILQDSLYQVAWMNNHRDYVVFPSGIATDDEERHVYISFGHQDKDGYIAKYDLEELWASLEVVSECRTDHESH